MPIGEQETLGGGCKHVEDMKVGWGVWSCAIGRVGRMEMGKGPTCA